MDGFLFFMVKIWYLFLLDNWLDIVFFSSSEPEKSWELWILGIFRYFDRIHVRYIYLHLVDVLRYTYVVKYTTHGCHGYFDRYIFSTKSLGKLL